MSSSTQFTMTAKVDAPYEETVARVREALPEIGFGVLTEIDIAATLKNKLDVDVPPKIILGACQPQLAHKALQADPRVAAIMPCNVVVSDAGDGTSTVEAMDPNLMPQITGTSEIESVVDDARERLSGMLDSLSDRAGS